MTWEPPSLSEERAALEQIASTYGIPLGLLLSCPTHYGPLDAATKEVLAFPERPAFRLLSSLGREGLDFMIRKMRGKAIPAPIILHRPHQNPLLVAGGARFFVAKVLGVSVMALHLRLYE